MLEAAWTSNFTPPARSRNFTRRPASASATLSVHAGGGARGRGPGAGKEGRSSSRPRRLGHSGGEGSGAGAGTGLRRPVLARPAARAPSAAALLSIHPGLLHYILLNLNTSNTSFIGPAIQPTIHPAIFQYTPQYII